MHKEILWIVLAVFALLTTLYLGITRRWIG
jgi:hypothetical protein